MAELTENNAAPTPPLRPRRHRENGCSIVALVAYRVMVVCTGNICRSPMAEVMLRAAFAKAGLTDVIVDSTGISDEEEGNPIDRRARRVLSAHRLSVPDDHQARQISYRDLSETDLILPMTAHHAAVLRQRAMYNQLDASPDVAKIRMFRSFDPQAPAVAGHQEHLLDVEDPWYGGRQDFEDCYAELQAAIPGIVAYVAEQGRR